DKMVQRTLEQGVQCRDDDGCKYKYGNNHCPVGHLMVILGVKETSRIWKSTSGVCSIPRHFIQVDSIGYADWVDVLSDAQVIHDKLPVKQWRTAFKALRKKLVMLAKAKPV